MLIACSVRRMRGCWVVRRRPAIRRRSAWWPAGPFNTEDSAGPRSRAIVQFGRLATGSSSNGVTTRKAVSLFTGDGPGATLAFKVSMPPRLKSLRHSRTVSSRTLNASAMRGLSNLKASAGWRVLYPPRRDHVSQPEPLKPSVGPRSPKQETCRSCHALTNSMPIANRTPIRWSSSRSLLRDRVRRFVRDKEMPACSSSRHLKAA